MSGIGRDRDTAEAHDRMVSWLELLRKQRPGCYHTAARALGFRGLIAALGKVIERRRRSSWGEEVSLPGLVHLLDGLADGPDTIPAERRDLVRDLCRLHAGHRPARPVAGSAELTSDIGAWNWPVEPICRLRSLPTNSRPVTNPLVRSLEPAFICPGRPDLKTWIGWRKRPGCG